MGIVSGVWALCRYPHPILIDWCYEWVLYECKQCFMSHWPGSFAVAVTASRLRSTEGTDLPFRLLLILQCPDKWWGLPLPLDWIIIPSICSPPVQSINCYCYLGPWCDVDDDVSLSSVKWKAVKNGQRTNALQTRTLKVNRKNEAPYNHLLLPSSTYPSTYNRLAKI